MYPLFCAHARQVTGVGVHYLGSNTQSKMADRLLNLPKFTFQCLVTPLYDLSSVTEMLLIVSSS